jgi:hypothetical protein
LQRAITVALAAGRNFLWVKPFETMADRAYMTIGRRWTKDFHARR